MNRTQLEHDIETFPFWATEFQRIQHYWECARSEYLPWAFVIRVLDNYLTSNVIPSQEGANDIAFLRDVARQHVH